MAAEALQILVFEVAGRHYGLPVADVRELQRAVTILPLPHAEPAVEGIINLRGAIVPVVDLRRRLRLAPKPLECSDHFIVAQSAGRQVALRVDRALDLVQLDAAAVEDARKAVPGAEGIAWVARMAGDLVLIPDLQHLLARLEPPQGGEP